MAIEKENYDVVKFMGDLPKNEQLLLTIERALAHGAIHDQRPMVQLLCHLKTNAPRQASIDEAFVKATKFAHLEIAQELYILQENHPSQKAVDDALCKSIEGGYFQVVKYVCQLPDIKPSKVAVDKALLESVKSDRLDIIQLLCGLEKPRPGPSQRALEQATLHAATKSACLPIVEFLSRSVSNKVIVQTMQLAAQHGYLAIVQHCCAVSSPSPKALQLARRKAVSAGHVDVVNFLRGVRGSVASSLPVESTQSEAVRVPALAGMGRPTAAPRRPERMRRGVPTSGLAELISHADISRSTLPQHDGDSNLRRSVSCSNLTHMGLFSERREKTQQVSSSQLAVMTVPR